MIETLVMIMAGGHGARLHPLTETRAKPAVPFGARYRIIDFVLSNFINSGYFRIKVLTQYRSSPLLIHLSRGYNFGSLPEHYVDAVPAHIGETEQWYRGTADAIFQNLDIIYHEDPHDVAIFGGDHIYKMDIRQMARHHREKRADCTVACLPFDRKEAAGQFGVVEVDADWRIIGFEEKPADPKPIPSMPDKALVSMGNYFFDCEALVAMLHCDHDETRSRHDFGSDILPNTVHKHRIYAYNFLDNSIPGETESDRGYWRDVGSIDAFYDANMDLRSAKPALNLYNYEWPIMSSTLQHPPVKFVLNEDGRRGVAIESIVANGAIISGARIHESVVFSNVFVHSYASVSQSILMAGCNIGRGARLKKVICDEYVTIEDGAVIGEDLESDAKRFTVSPGGVVVLPCGATVLRNGRVLRETVFPPAGSLRPREHLSGAVVITPEDTP